MIVLKLINSVNMAIGKAASFLIWVGIVVLCFEVAARSKQGQPKHPIWPKLSSP